MGEGVQLAVRLVVAALLIWLPYRLISRSPRGWWLYCALALIPVVKGLRFGWTPGPKHSEIQRAL